MIVLGIFFSYKTYNLLNRLNANVSKQDYVMNLNTQGPYQPQTMGFDFAFGIGGPLDPSIGYYTATEVIQYIV